MFRVFYDGRKAKITAALKEIGGVKMNYGKPSKGEGWCTYRDLSLYDYIIEDGGWVANMRSQNVYQQFGGVVYSLWWERYITSEEFFQKIEQTKNLDFIKTL